MFVRVRRCQKWHACEHTHLKRIAKLRGNRPFLRGQFKCPQAPLLLRAQGIHRVAVLHRDLQHVVR